MSSIITKKKTVVLLVPGLGQTHEFYDPTVKKLVTTSSKAVRFEHPINMQDFDVKINYFKGKNDDGYFSRSQKKFLEFNTLISDITTKSNLYKNRAIIVKVDLEAYPYFANGEVEYGHYDSINNQASKLCYIIDAIKAMDETIDIILVGHSQGGLVNLETATRRPTKIKKLISISTPYRSVWIADLLTLPLIFNRVIAKTMGYDIIEENLTGLGTGLENVNYQNRILDLSSEPFFVNLHARWMALTTRPQLTVITGTSGHLVTKDNGIIRTKQSFDGLVRTYEQKGVAFAKYVNLTHTSVPCYLLKTVFNETCHDSIISPCKYLCQLPNFGVAETLSRAAFESLYNAIKTGSMENMKNDFGAEITEVGAAIEAGLGRSQTFNDAAHQNYYDIYASDYSHFYLPQCNETIGTLLTEFQN